MAISPGVLSSKAKDHLFTDKCYLLSTSGKAVNTEFLLGKVICLLYGAAWSPPFLEFLENFQQFYQELQAEKPPLEVIYIGFDRTKEEMTTLSQTFPKDWVCVPHGHTLANYLKLKYNIVVIPKLVVVRDDGTVITDMGVKEVRRRSNRCFTTWFKSAGVWE